LEKQSVITQLIAHDKEVYDIAFAKGKDVFASVGADGSLRMFDLRNLEHSTIVYESQQLEPLLRLSWNKQDNNYVATIFQDGTKVIILDIRLPSCPVVELDRHTAPVNSICWSPHSAHHLVSAADDSNVLIWDLKEIPKPIEFPILSYKAPSEVNQIQWSTLHPDWVSISFDQTLQILKI
jgi:DDB1- and CUL4-associated factor 7